MAQPFLYEFFGLKWHLHEQNPVISPPYGSPVIADPTFLTPDESTDGQWHLFAHSVWGLHHYVSANGLAWQHHRLMFTGAMRAHIFAENNKYYLLYERYTPFKLFISWLPGLKWYSEIVMRESDNLITWSKPHTLLQPTLPWHTDAKLGSAVGNPCLVKTGKKYRLYYSASLVHLPDCGFNEPKYIGVATSDKINGVYMPLPEPVISPHAADNRCNLGAGAIKAIYCADGFAGFQNSIYLNLHTNKSSSAIQLLTSENGIDWHYADEYPLLAPGQPNWMRSHVYALDVKKYGNGWYLFFNARNDWHWTKGREHIGLLTAIPPP
ncbi:glycosyl hydrolase family 43 [Sphingobacteriales bacterium UPWRP_1]|nr:hypothetical protein BVG80_03635 [Sphingobacteriales bacterium TSM_CSM]PSJ75686.1 glycosyl hydrolase family 43 [Sphingobacteriales bacterium UPWRP_1]